MATVPLLKQPPRLSAVTGGRRREKPRLEDVDVGLNPARIVARVCPECKTWQSYPANRFYCDKCMESTGTNYVLHLVATRGYPPQAPLFPDMTLGGDDWQTMMNYQSYGEGDAPRSHVTIPQWPPKSKQELAQAAYERRPLAERIAEEEAARQDYLNHTGLFAGCMKHGRKA